MGTAAICLPLLPLSKICCRLPLGTTSPNQLLEACLHCARKQEAVDSAEVHEAACCETHCALSQALLVMATLSSFGLGAKLKSEQLMSRLICNMLEVQVPQ